jgi:hypothetical protein
MTEARYARLLRLYPAGYPRDEMLGVLLAGGRPFHRELPALVLGGLRARAGGGQSLGVRWLHAVRVAALFLLVANAGDPLVRVIDGAASPIPVVVTSIATGLAIIAIIVGWRRPACAFAVVAFLAASMSTGSWYTDLGYMIPVVLLLIPGPRTPVAAPLALTVAVVLEPPGPAWLMLALLFVLVLWSLIDERILIAIGIMIGTGTIELAHHLSLGVDPQVIQSRLAFYVLIPAALLGIGAVLARRRTRI